MRMKFLKFFILTFIFFFSANSLNAQCNVNATASQTTVFCGDCVELSVFGQGQGQSVFVESFNSGAPTGWQSTSQATYTNPCSPGGVDGTPHLWMGNAASVPRRMVTTPFDFSSASAGATICFDMLYAVQGAAAPCEGPDLSAEGVAIEYSIDGGNTWLEIEYWDPNGGNDPQLTNWNNYCVAIPPAGITSSTQIRWSQTNDSGADYDHWGLDNVNIYFNDPTYVITWDHDNFSYPVGDSGGPNPNLVCPQSTTTYSVTMTNGSTTCTDEITINVEPRQFRVTAEQDQEVCSGDCVSLDGEATVIVSPAKQPTYSNSEVSPLTGLPSAQDLLDIFLPIPCFDFGGCNCPDGSSVNFGQQCPPVSSATFNATLSMPINIVDLNTTTLQTGELVEVCIGDAIMPTGDFSPFEIRLVCPSGQSIILANPGDITGNFINGACFDLTSATPISAATPNYGGNWQPVEPFSNLSGCDANGEWELVFDGEFTFSQGNVDLPVGFLNGWDISFDDPEISYEGDFTWSPTTNMTDETTLNPTVCVSSDEFYVLSVTDTAGCEVVRDTVFLTIDPDCCPIQFDPTITEPACGASNGEISVAITDGSGNYEYTWTGDETGNTNTISNLGAGTYNLSVYDVDLDCTRDTSFTLILPDAPVIDTASAVDETCSGDNDGSVTASASGGTGVLTYTWTPGNLDGATQDNLAPTNYTVTVEDENGCTAQQTVTINQGPDCCNLSVEAAITNSTCNNTDGSIELTVTDGSGNYSFSWASGTNELNNLAAGNYPVTITDLDEVNCSIDTTFNISDADGPVLTISNIVNPTCGASDGSLTANLSGGTAPYTVTIDTGGTPIVLPVPLPIGAPIDNLPAGTVNITVEDDNGCSTFETVTLDEPQNCCPITVEANITNATCNDNNGSIVLIVSNGTGNYSYSWASGTDELNGIGAGNYPVIITDEDAPVFCSIDTSFTVIDADGPVIDNLTVVNESCQGQEDGSATVAVSGGTGQLSIVWSSGGGDLTEEELAAGNYTVTVTDENNCSTSEDFTIVAGGPCCDLEISEILTTSETCLGFSDGEATVITTGGVAPLSFDWNGNTSSEDTETGLSAGTYTLTVTDDNGCEATETFEIEAGVEVSVFAGNDTTINIGDSLQLNLDILGGTSGVAIWTPETGLSCGDCLNPIASPSEDIVYFVTYTDDLGCETNDDISITINFEEPFCLFPDAFTPNQDNVNDFFRGICERVVFLEMKVYNRWGELVFEEQGANNLNGWDGTYKGRDANLGVYVYKVNVQFEDGTTEMYMGNLSLIR